MVILSFDVAPIRAPGLRKPEIPLVDAPPSSRPMGDQRSRHPNHPNSPFAPLVLLEIGLNQIPPTPSEGVAFDVFPAPLPPAMGSRWGNLKWNPIDVTV